MSQAIISSPIAQAQMSFVWDGTSSIEPTENVARRRNSRRSKDLPARLAEQSVAQVLTNQQSSVASLVDIREVASSSRLSFHNDRIGKPVRIGSIMFRLLKKYGISDEEIAEGIAKYASAAN